MPGEYFEARERALLGTRYDVLYAASCAVRRGVTVNGLRCAPQEFAAAVDFGLEPSPFCDAAFLLTDPQLRPGRHAYHHAGVFYVQEPSASVPAGLLGVRPGDTVETRCRIRRAKPPFYFASGEVTVDGRLCVTAEFSFAVTAGD